MPVCTGVLLPRSSSKLLPSSSRATADSLGVSSPNCDKSVPGSATACVAFSVLMRVIRLVKDTRLAGSVVPATIQPSGCFSTRTDLSAWCNSNAFTLESSNWKIWGCWLAVVVAVALAMADVVGPMLNLSSPMTRTLKTRATARKPMVMRKFIAFVVRRELAPRPPHRRSRREHRQRQQGRTGNADHGHLLACQHQRARG